MSSKQHPTMNQNLLCCSVSSQQYQCKFVHEQRCLSVPLKSCPLISTEQCPLISTEQCPLISPEPCPLISPGSCLLISPGPCLLIHVQLSLLITLEPHQLILLNSCRLIPLESCLFLPTELILMIPLESCLFIPLELCLLLPLEPYPLSPPKSRTWSSLKPSLVTSLETRPSIPLEPSPSIPLEPSPSIPLKPRPLIPLKPSPLMSLNSSPLIPLKPGPLIPLKPVPLIPLKPVPLIPHKPGPLIPLKPGPSIPLEPSPSIPLEPSPSIPLKPSPLMSLTPSPLIPLKPVPLIPLKPSPLIPLEPSPLIPLKSSPLIPLKPSPLIPLKPSYPSKTCDLTNDDDTTESDNSNRNDSKLTSASERWKETESYKSKTSDDTVLSASVPSVEVELYRNPTNEDKTTSISERPDDSTQKLWDLDKSYIFVKNTPEDHSAAELPSADVQQCLNSHKFRSEERNVELTKAKKEGSPEDHKSPGREETDPTSVLRDLITAPTIRYTPLVVKQVWMLQPGDDQRYWEEGRRLATFHKYNVPQGVWISRLATSGFYLSDKGRSIVRCSYCDAEEDINHFRNRDPTELHRRDPPCPLVTGQAGNISMQRLGQVTGRSFNRAMFGATEKHGRDLAAFDSFGKPLVSNEHGQKSNTDKFSSLPTAAGLPELQPAALVSYGQSDQSGFSSDAQERSPNTDEANMNTGTAISLPPTFHSSGHSSTLSRTESSSSQLQSTESASQRGRHQRTDSAQTGASGRQATPQQTPAPQNMEPISPPAPQTHAPSAERSRHNSASGQSPHPSSAPTSNQTAQRSPFQTSWIEEPAASRNDVTGSAGNSQPASTSSATTGSSNSPPSSSASTSTEQERQVVTYSQLGIYTQEPKRPDLAIAATRTNTYTNWPHSSTHTPEEMAEAGFYFVGHSDLVRCFYCKGGLKSWTGPLRPWVEHARFFPQCPFVGQVKGQEYVDVVQEIKSRQDRISASEVEEEVQRRLRILDQVADGEEGAAADSADGATGGDTDDCVEDDEDDDDDRLCLMANELEIQNQEISNRDICKVCQTDPVQIIFVPCGHLCACAQCSPALRTCAICRQLVRGRVRVSVVKRHQ